MEQRDDVEVFDTDNVTLEYLSADFKRRRKNNLKSDIRNGSKEWTSKR